MSLCTRLLSAVFLCAAVAFGVHAETLTVARMFGAPDLSGPQLLNPTVSPDGKFIAYLQGKPDDPQQLDLWAFDISNGRARMLVDSQSLAGGETISAAEAARRERQRTANLHGIVAFQFSSDGRRLLVPLGGELYLYDLHAHVTNTLNPVRHLTHNNGAATDARFSPRDNFVSFIRAQNLWLIDLRSGKEKQLTHDGGGPIANGVAEFIAQEEMGRTTGYWWSPDEKRIAYTRTDDEAIPEIERVEIYADHITSFHQRYPSAGSANTSIALKILTLDSGASTDVDLGSERNIYLTRVDWFPDSQALAVQREARNQQQLDLLKANIFDGKTQILITETSNTWIDLCDDITFIPEKHEFIWTSERTGFRHLYLYDEDGTLLRPLTAGAWMVADNREHAPASVDSKRGLVFFLSNQASPTEQNLYATSLDTTTPTVVQRISKESGWHDTEIIRGSRSYLDVFSSPEQPPSVAIRNIDGSLHRWVLRNALDTNHPYASYLKNHVTEEFGTLAASDGQLLQYRLLQPANRIAGKRYPVIFDVYGGPGIQYVTRSWMGGGHAGYFRQILAQQGFAVFSLDNRGTGMRGTAFQSPIFRQFGKVEIQDQLRGVEFLKTLDFIDSNRIGIMGWSYGGYMTLMALTTAPQVFKAGIAGAPVTDWRLYDTHYTERYLGDPQQNPQGYVDSSVAAHLKNLSGRLFLVHGMADDNVLFTNSTQLMQELQAQHQTFDLMTYPGGKHGLVRDPIMGRHFYESALQFFKEHL